MTTTIAQAGFTEEAFREFLDSRDEPSWLSELRREAWRAFDELPMPSQRDEEWMRTDIRLLRLEKFGLPVAPPVETLPVDPLLLEGMEVGGRVASLDSHPIESQLDDELAARGVLLGSLESLVREHEDILRPHLERRVVNPSYDKFSALNAAFWQGGALLYVPRGVAVDVPLHSFVAMTDGGVDLGRTLIVVEDGAEATLVAETRSATPDAAGFHCGAVEMIVGPRARLRFVNLQNWGAKTWHFAHQKALVDREGKLQWTIGGLGARLAKANQHVALIGRGADAQVNGVMFTEGKQHLSYHTLQHHQAPACHSDLLYKAVLQDQSRTVWRGMIKVDPDAQQTDGYQRNDNLLLSSEARADAIPGLEIEADDVRCTHGSTSGRVDQEQIFYCLSRGLTRNEAIRMIVTGFFQQVFDRITIESVREALGETVRRRVREYD